MKTLTIRTAIAPVLALATGLTISSCAPGANPLEASSSEATNRPSLARATSITENVQIPLDLTVFIPCALGGAGESVTLSGDLHVLLHLTENSTGGFHVKTHFQPQGVSGVGLTSGGIYRATGVTQDQLKVGANDLPVVFTYVNNFRIIGPGPGNNFLVHETFHVTINANGETAVEVDIFKGDCK